MNFRRHATALVLAGFAVSACATAPEKAASVATPSDPTLGKAAEFGMPSDLDGAVHQAQMQRLGGDYEGAARTLSQLMLFAPDDPRVVGEYGKTLVARGRTNDALAFLKRAIELNPMDWTLYSAQGVAYDQNANYKMAQASYAAALRFKPGDPGVLSNSALSYMQAGNLVAAEQQLALARQNGGDDPRIAQNIAMLNEMKGVKAATVTQPVAVASTKPAPQIAAPPAPLPVAPMPAPQKSASVPAVTPSAAISAPRSLTALQNDPSVRMAPIPKETAPPKAAPVKQAAVQPAAQSAKTAAPSPALAALQKDPSVRMAPVPVETAAAPKPVAIEKAKPASAPAPGKVAEAARAAPKAKPEAVMAEPEAAEAKPMQKMAQDEKLTRLRPALSEVVASRR